MRKIILTVSLLALGLVSACTQEDGGAWHYGELNGNGTVIDNNTGLVWKRCGEGLSGESCSEGSAKKYTWREAQEGAEQASFVGHTDWRVPTLEELHSIIYCSAGRRGIKSDDMGKHVEVNGLEQDGRCLGKGYARPTINQVAFPNSEITVFWSSTPSLFKVGDAWQLNFQNGVRELADREVKSSVRLVRDE